MEFDKEKELELARAAQKTTMEKRKKAPKPEKKQGGYRGTLYIDIVQARRLKAADTNGKSDPYVEVASGNYKKKTTVKKNNLHPVWNERLEILIQGSNLFKLTVFDEDKVDIDDKIGELTFDLSYFDNGALCDKWWDFPSMYGGQIRLRILFRSAKLDGVLKINVIEAKNLIGADAGGKSSDPFVRVAVGKEKQATKVIQKTLNPKWEKEEKEFKVNGEGCIICEVFDKDKLKNDKIGWVEIKLKPWTPLLCAGVVDEWFDLCEKGSLHLKMQYWDNHFVYP